MGDKTILRIDMTSDIESARSCSLEKGQKKEVMLNLGIVNKSEGVDETPTPTRLIRNCEEVGLFQDLQNVNPFDEYFKKAVENKAYLTPSNVLTQSADDSLHTPQIYPQPEEQIEKHSVIKSVEKFELDLDLIDNNDTNESNDALIIVNSDEEDDHKEDVKAKVKNALIQKAQGIKTIPIKQLQEPKREIKTESRPLNVSKEEWERKVANRWSQARCRVKKRKQWNDLKDEVEELKMERAKLKEMNAMLEERVKKLEAHLQSIRSTKVINNDEDIPLHVIQKVPPNSQPPIATVPSTVFASQVIESSKTTIVNHHQEPLHIIESRPANIPLLNTSRITILNHTKIIPQVTPSNDVYVIMQPQTKDNTAKRKVTARQIKKERHGSRILKTER